MRQPIEFDLLSLCASPVTDFKVADLAQDACNFDVSKLFCLERESRLLVFITLRILKSRS